MTKRRRLPMAVPLFFDEDTGRSIDLPRGHSPGMRVSHGGSSCATCRFGNVRTGTCREPNFVRWNGSRRIPAPMSSYCSDWWQPKT